MNDGDLSQLISRKILKAITFGLAFPALAEQMARVERLCVELEVYGVPVAQIDAICQRIGYSPEFPEYPTLTDYTEHIHALEGIRAAVMAGEPVEPIIERLVELPSIVLPWETRKRLRSELGGQSRANS